MSYEAWAQARPSQDELNSSFISAMSQVYLWMTGGLVLTTAVALVVATNPNAQGVIFSNSFNWILLIGAQIGLVLLISAAIDKLAPPVALGLFFLYSALTGVTLSVVFLVFDLGSIGLAFGSAASIFAAMSIVGLTTKKDLTQWGPILMAALFGLIVASVANWFLQSSVVEWLVSFVGVIIFMGLTVYDSKRIKERTSEALVSGDTMAVNRIGIIGALHLYLDLLNMFLLILHFVGGGDD